MCTGDNIDTAIAISKNAQIVTDREAEMEYTCMTGQQFRDTVGIMMPDPADPTKNIWGVNKHQFQKVKKNLRVLARSSPEDKFLLVTGL